MSAHITRLSIAFLICWGGCQDAKDKVQAVVDSPAARAAIEIGKALNDAVERDTSIEPIYEPLDDQAAIDETDAAIKDMARVEVIDGLTIGMEDMARTDTQKHETRSGFLVLWRQGSHRVGFVYRTSRTIDLAQLANDAPRLISLARRAAGAE